MGGGEGFALSFCNSTHSALIVGIQYSVRDIYFREGGRDICTTNEIDGLVLKKKMKVTTAILRIMNPPKKKSRHGLGVVAPPARGRDRPPH